MGCGDPQHRFATRADKNKPLSRHIFWQELWAHIPTTRIRKWDPILQCVLDKYPKCNIAVAETHTLQAIHSDQNLKRPANTTQTSQPISKARWFAIFVRVTNISSSPKKPMSISINNSLPSVCLHLGIPEDDENRIQMLVDTGDAMNTGDLNYHLWVMSQCPDIIEEFLQCGKDTDYDVVHLLAAIDLSGVPTDDDHGQMTAVIRYKTPYTVNGKDPFILSFALGNDVSLHCVFGLPTLLAMGASIGLASGL